MSVTAAWMKQSDSVRTVDFAVSVVPRSSSCAVAGRNEAGWRIHLTAAPVRGAANEQLVRFLSGLLGVPRSAFRILAGGASRRKRIRLTSNLSGEEVERLFVRAFRER